MNARDQLTACTAPADTLFRPGSSVSYEPEGSGAVEREVDDGLETRSALKGGRRLWRTTAGVETSYSYCSTRCPGSNRNLTSTDRRASKRQEHREENAP